MITRTGSSRHSPRTSHAAASTTADILHSKLKVANASIGIAEERATRACAEAARVSAETGAQLDAMQRALRDAQEAKIAAERERDAALRPPADEEARVRALEHAAYEARRARDACVHEHADDPEHPAREAAEEEAHFRSAVAKQARHCLMRGTMPAPMPAHFHLRPTGAFLLGTASAAAVETDAQQASTLALAARLEELVRDDRTFEGTIGTAATTAGHWTMGKGSHDARATAARMAAANQRLQSFMSNVCKDVKEGLDCNALAYETAKVATSATMRAPRV